MSENMLTFQLGAARISVINIGDFVGKLEESIKIPENERPPDYAAVFEQVEQSPMQCILIQLPTMKVMVDAGVHEASWALSIPDYQPPPSLLARLAELGVKPGEITHVVITHAHFDHFNGVTQETDDHYEPCFPNAPH